MKTKVKKIKEYELGQNEDCELITNKELIYLERITINDIREHLTGPFFSFILHIFIIIFLGSVIIINPPEEKRELEIKIVEPDIREWQKPKPPDPLENNQIETEYEIEIEQVNSISDIQIDDIAEPDSPLEQSVLPPIIPVNMSPLIFPIPVNRTEKGKEEAIKTYKALPQTKKATIKALRWLRDHQNPDGSWGEGKNTKAFLTSVALLAFLGHGEIPKSQEFGNCVLKAIKKLIEMVNARDANGLIKDDRNCYGHAAVAYALAEASLMTQIPIIETAMNSMVETLVRAQNPQGGYNYGHNNSNGRFDLSVSGWHYQALKAAFVAGSNVPGLETAMEKAVKGLKQTMHAKDGGFIYSTEPGKEKDANSTSTMTSVGALCLQLLGEGKSRETNSAIRWLKEKNNSELMKCNWTGIDNYKCGRAKTWPIYLWYYQTQTIFQHTEGTGPLWDSWNKEFQNALLKEQFPDGHWTSPVERYSKHGKDGHGENVNTFEKMPIDLDIYSTALCCLMLEVYYRNLHTFKVTSANLIKTGKILPEEIKPDTDLKIE